MVAVFLRNDVLVHVVGGVTNHLPDAVGFDFKFYRVGRIVIVPFRTLQFLNEIASQRQLFGCFHKTVCIGVEHIRFLGGAAAGGVDHGNAGLITIVIQFVQGKRGVGDFDRPAGFGVGLDKLQIALQFLIQHVVGHIVIGGCSDASHRNRESALRAVGVYRHDERITLEHILRDGRFDNKILPIRQAFNAENALIIGEHFSQPIFSGLIRGHPAVAFTVGAVTVCGQGRVIDVDRIGAALEHIGNGLTFGGEIVF